MQRDKSITETPTGRSIRAFARAVGLGRTTLYQLPAEQRPRSLRFGRRRVVVVEQPAEWLQRVGRRIAEGE